MELSQLKYFKAVAENGKISTAAEELFLSAPALSNSISKLEKELGVQLFDRTSNSLKINQHGEILLRYTNQILHTVDRARAEIQQSVLRQNQHIWIAATVTNIWLSLIASFSLEYPQLTLSYTYMNPKESNRSFASKYAFFLAEEKEVASSWGDEMEGILLFEDQPVVMVSPSHPFARQKSVDIHCLQNELLLLPARESSQYDQFMKLFQENDMPTPEATCCAFSLYHHMVEKNSHVALTTMHSYRPPNLCYVPIECHSPSWKMYLYWRKEHIFTNEEQTFKSFVENFYHIEP